MSIRDMLGVVAPRQEEAEQLDPVSQRQNRRRNGLTTAVNLNGSGSKLEYNHEKPQLPFGENTLRKEILEQRLSRLGIKNDF